MYTISVGMRKGTRDGDIECANLDMDITTVLFDERINK